MVGAAKVISFILLRKYILTELQKVFPLRYIPEAPTRVSVA